MHVVFCVALCFISACVPFCPFVYGTMLRLSLDIWYLYVLYIVEGSPQDGFDQSVAKYKIKAFGTSS